MSITLKQVAEKAGVSQATASLAISGKKAGQNRISPDTVDLVKKAATLIGYRPNALASSLRNNITHMIGVSLSSISFSSEETLSGIKQEVYPSFTPVLAVHNYDGSCEKVELEAFLSKRVDGIIAAFSGDLRSVEIYQDLIRRYNIPTVLINRSIPGLNLPVVRSDHHGGTYRAIKTLLELGHRYIHYATVSASKEMMEGHRLRMEGYKDAMKEAGLKGQVRITSELGKPNWTQKKNLQDVAHVVVDAWQEYGKPASALFLDNDWLACAVLGELKCRNIKVPEDVSVMGYGGYNFSALKFIDLSTVDARSEAIGTEAANLLLKLIAGEQWDDKPIVLPGEVMMGGTTRAV